MGCTRSTPRSRPARQATNCARTRLTCSARRWISARHGDGPAALGPKTHVNRGDPVSRWIASADRALEGLVGDRLTPLIGMLGVVLALALGAGHAALPGHGKTVMAAYLAGRHGRPRDAVIVGATVTLTHTGGVLVLGLLLT